MFSLKDVCFSKYFLEVLVSKNKISYTLLFNALFSMYDVTIQEVQDLAELSSRLKIATIQALKVICK